MNQWRTIVGAAACAAMAAGIGLGLTWPADAQNTAQNNAAGGAGRGQVLSTASPSAGSGQSGGAAGSWSGAGASSGQGSNGQGSGGSGSNGGGSQSATALPSGGTGASGTATPSGGASGSTPPKYYTPILGPVRALFTPTVQATPPTPQTTGPTCLMGYVWRQAISGDFVCVTPATRTQAAADNAAAAGRVNPQGGPYGPDTCLQGYVWRQVVASDHVCVTPATRAQVLADNAQGTNRELLMNLWLSDWTPPSPPQNCSGNVCSVTEGGGGAQFQVNGDNFNFGQVRLDIRSDSNNALVWTTLVTAQAYTGFPGAALYAQTPLLDCSTDPYATANDYLQAYDEVSGQWSAKLPVNSDCASF